LRTCQRLGPINTALTFQKALGGRIGNGISKDTIGIVTKSTRKVKDLSHSHPFS
jgi:hypothetical protein